MKSMHGLNLGWPFGRRQKYGKTILHEGLEKMENIWLSSPNTTFQKHVFEKGREGANTKPIKQLKPQTHPKYPPNPANQLEQPTNKPQKLVFKNLFSKGFFGRIRNELSVPLQSSPTCLLGCPYVCELPIQ